MKGSCHPTGPEQGRAGQGKVNSFSNGAALHCTALRCAAPASNTQQWRSVPQPSSRREAPVVFGVVMLWAENKLHFSAQKYKIIK